MRPRSTRRAGVLASCAAALALLGAGPGKDGAIFKKAEPPLKVDETVGDVAVVQNGEFRVEGVGLVVGLDGTGSDPEPSIYREKLLNMMRKARVERAEQILRRGDTSLVLVKGVIPTGITTKDVFDVEIELTPGSTTRSLAGGTLLLTELEQIGVVRGAEIPGQVMAKAWGPVMIGTAGRPDDPKVGRVPGGGRAKKDIEYRLVIGDRRKSFKTSARLQQVINQRFHQLKGIDQQGMATAKTDQYLILRIPPAYHQNQKRFFQVVQLLPLVDAPELRARRMERWAKELLDPKTAGIAALRFEGIGRNAVDALKAGLASPSPQVRFFAAEALAYLNDASGIDALGRAVATQPEYRAFALAAMAATDQPASSLKLRELMAHADPQVRYGAFNALRTLDPDDPFLGRVRVRHDEPEPPAEDGDAMAMQIATARPRRRPDDPFSLYVVDTDGPPLIHVARTRRCEIVLFGKGQRLQTPVVLGGAGTLLLNAAEGDDRVQIARIAAGDLDGPDRKVTASLHLGEVIREAANLGATYPELLAVLQAADRQKNLPGALVVDAVPAPVAAYDRAQLAGLDPTAKADSAVGRAGAEKESKRPAPRRRLLDRMRGRFGRN